MAKLTDSEWNEILDKWHREPTVEIKVNLEGHLCIDGEVVLRNIDQRLGNHDALALEIRLMRAVEKAERRMAERLTR